MVADMYLFLLTWSRGLSPDRCSFSSYLSISKIAGASPMGLLRSLYLPLLQLQFFFLFINFKDSRGISHGFTQILVFTSFTVAEL